MKKCVFPPRVLLFPLWQSSVSERASDSRSEAQAPAVRQWLSSVCSFLSLLFIFFRFCLQTFFWFWGDFEFLFLFLFFNISAPTFPRKGQWGTWGDQETNLLEENTAGEPSWIMKALSRKRASAKKSTMSFLANSTSSSWMTDPCKSMNHDSWWFWYLLKQPLSFFVLPSSFSKHNPETSKGDNQHKNLNLPLNGYTLQAAARLEPLERKKRWEEEKREEENDRIISKLI